MDVEVCETIGQQQPRQVEDFRSGRAGKRLARSTDDAVFDQYVSVREKAAFQVQRGAFQHKFYFHADKKKTAQRAVSVYNSIR